ncbi:MAG: beta-mannosidase, partial [Clostridia bacterium]|nr:beta-mannosidase [Clostridia bacterium]
MCEAFLYDLTVTVSFEGEVCDTHSFKFGVRTFAADYTKGEKYRTRWNKFLFSVNGQEFFLKGMNWIQIDYLYDISPERYEWCLNMAKNAGIQLIRVWTGGGMQ